MLVITRRMHEKIMITIPGRTEPIVVTLCGQRENKVRIGIDAPPDIRVWREEIFTPDLLQGDPPCSSDSGER